VQRIFIDPQHLKQIFLNLLGNSIQAMSKSGTIFVNVKLLKDSAQITYADTGPGIKPELVDKIFEPFFTTREKGTGLGLAVVKNLVDENRGKIKLIESKNIGATFLIEFFKEL
jgi:signal transduction histidine kinase